MSDRCIRCGQCCISVGKTFWRNGDFPEGHPLARRAARATAVDGGLPCEMLKMVHGRATCTIERIYGRECKPQVCRDYPEGEPCQYQAGVNKEPLPPAMTTRANKSVKPCPRCGGTDITPLGLHLPNDTWIAGGVCHHCAYAYWGTMQAEPQPGEALEVRGGRPEKA